jgi:hypothetical protein
MRCEWTSREHAADNLLYSFSAKMLVTRTFCSILVIAVHIPGSVFLTLSSVASHI